MTLQYYFFVSSWNTKYSGKEYRQHAWKTQITVRINTQGWVQKGKPNIYNSHIHGDSLDIGRWMDKEDVVHVYKWNISQPRKRTRSRHLHQHGYPSADECIKMWCMYTHGILVTHKKERDHAICSNMDGPRECHTRWGKPEKDKKPKISHICGILKKGYKWTFLQNRNRVADIEN